MNNNNINCSIELLIELLSDYKKIFTELTDLSAVIEKNSKDCYASFFSKNLSEIQESIDKHNQNIERAKKINDEITLAVSNWYDFVKNPSEVSRLAYPFRFLIRGKSFKKSIKNLHEELSSIQIENRFIAEQVTIWEHKLETEVIREARGSEAYTGYEKASASLEAVVCELKYLIPTIPGLCPVKICPSDIDALIKKVCFVQN